MGRNARVDQVRMLQDDGVLISQSRELEILASHGTQTDTSVMVGNDDEEDANDLYVGTPTPSVPTSSELDFERHEPLMRSRVMGKCNDPYCATCPSYFGYIETFKPYRERQDGRGNVRRAWSKLTIPILNPHSKVAQRWNKIFCISSLIAIFVDPLFFLLLSVRKEYLCLVFNNTAAIVVTVIRSVIDSVHICHIFLQFRMAYVGLTGELIDTPRAIAFHYTRGWLLLDVFTALPLPQILIWTLVKKMLTRESGANYAKNVLGVVVLIQNMPRGIRFLPLLIGRSPHHSAGAFFFKNAWAKFVINMLFYFLAGHIVGSSWYLFGLQRVNECSRRGCKDEEHATFRCEIAYLYCGDSFNYTQSFGNDVDRGNWLKNTKINDTCFGDSPKFHYGIYNAGVQVITQDSIFLKFIYSTFWGFQQISTLAGNQIPSASVGEVLFTFGIVALGLLLFALLIGNMQNFLQGLGRGEYEREMRLKRQNMEIWMGQRRLPSELRKRVRDEGLYKSRLTDGVDEEDLLRDMQEDLKMDILRYLSLDLVNKVRIFELLEDHVLDAICKRLHQKLYIPGSEVIRSKQPVERMLFIVRGELLSIGEDGSNSVLKEGEFCGEELLAWYIDTAGIITQDQHSGKQKAEHMLGTTKYPQASRTVKCLTAVEAFSLDSDGMEFITSHYKHAFRDPRVEGGIRYLSPYWRSLAAIRIQRGWRKYREGKSSADQASRRRQSRFGRMYTVKRRYPTATSGGPVGEPREAVPTLRSNSHAFYSDDQQSDSGDHPSATA